MPMRNACSRWAVIAVISLAAGCEESAAPDDEIVPARTHEIARTLPAEQALANAHIPTIDPAMMNDAETRKVLGTNRYCEFRYASGGRPVLAWGQEAGAADDGVVKLNGSLVPLTAESSDKALTLVDDGVRATVLVGESIDSGAPAKPS